MPDLPILKPLEVIKTFDKFGWKVPRGTLRGLISKAGITVEQFL